MNAPNIKNIQLKLGKKIFFASDFHLGTPSKAESLERERRIIRWLESISHEAQTIVLVGDIFDFWFEYKYTVPKGFVRFQGKIAELIDKGIEVIFFTGNHDMWMFGYFSEILGVPVFKDPVLFEINNKKIYVAHGDGLGPGDYSYKFLRKIFTSKICQWLFGWLHPTIGIGLAQGWSQDSRRRTASETKTFLGDKEWLWAYSKEVEAKNHHDFYIFGHRHLPLDLPVGEKSRYLNLGEWINYNTYAIFDGENLTLETFEKSNQSV
jgi:UDP-2,3-diacylglucosamine hydrolase